MDRDSAVHSPEPVLRNQERQAGVEALDGAGLIAEGCLIIKLSATAMGEATLETSKTC